MVNRTESVIDIISFTNENVSLNNSILLFLKIKIIQIELYFYPRGLLQQLF